MQPYNPNCALGIDVSKYQPEDIDWQAVRDAGISYVFVRASAGTDIRDDYFAAHVAGAKAAGLLVGIYHYFYAQSPEEAAQEAEHFLDVSGDLSQYDFPLALDVEDDQYLPADGSLPGICRAWLDKVYAAAGRKLIVYTSPGFAASHLDGSLGDDYLLWAANYTADDAPGDVAGWSEWTFWQHSETGRVPGIPDDVDLDRFCGTEEELRAMAYQLKADDANAIIDRWISHEYDKASDADQAERHRLANELRKASGQPEQ